MVVCAGKPEVHNAKHIFIVVGVVVAKPSKTQLGARIYLGGSSGTHEYNGSTYETEGFDVCMFVPLESPLGISMSGTFADSSDHTGFEYGWDAGVDLKLGFFVIGARYQMQFTAYESATVAAFEASTSAVIVMVGVAL